jgi:YbbR domain-containing protein
MKLISSTRGLFDNIGVKLIALVVAMVVWFNASGQQSDKRDYIADLSFVNLPDSVTLTGLVPDEVRLSVSGTRRELLFLRFRRINMLVNMARANPGRFTQRLSVSDLMLPPGIEPGDVRIVTPQLVDVNLEQVITKRLRVAVMLSGSLAADMLLNRVPEARPMWVNATGPKSAVDPLEKLPTKPIDLSKLRESVSREVQLEFNDEVLECVPDRVMVAVSVSARGQRVLANVPPTVLQDNDNYLTEVTPKTVSLTIEGPQAMLDTLSSRDVSVLIDLTGRPPGQYRLAPEIIVPDGVEKYVMNVDSLMIVVTKADESRSM